MTAADLWRTNHDIARSCVDHPYVQGIARGDLPRPAFDFFVAQDAVFLEGFARAYSLAVAKAPDRKAMIRFKSLLDGVFDELTLHADYARRWNVDLEPEPAPATRAYTDFLLRVAALEPLGPLCAAMTPCMRLYACIGSELGPGINTQNPYSAWVEAYADPAFEALARTLETLLDRYSPHDTSSSIGDHYRTALRLEYDFFSAAWAKGQT